MVVIVGGLGPAASAAAQGAPRADDGRDAQARLHFQVGAEYFETGDYRDAIREFERALQLSERPRMHYNIAGCYERLGQPAEAADHLALYLDAIEDIPNREALTRRLENLRERARELEAEAARAEPAVDELGEPPDEEPAAPESPRDEVAVAAPVTPASSSGGGPDMGLLGVSIAAFVVGGLGFATQGVLGGLALAEDEAISAGCGGSMSCRADEVATLTGLATGSDVGLAVGVTGIALGAVLLGVAFANGGEERDVALTVYGDPSGAGAAIHGRL